MPADQDRSSSPAPTRESPESCLPDPPQPSPDPLTGAPPAAPPFRAKSPSLSDPSGPRSQASLAEDELVARKKDLVAAFDKIIDPLDKILGLMQNAWRGGVLLLVFSALMVGVQVHTTLRMASVQAQLEQVVWAQHQLQLTTTQVANRQTATADQLAQQSQITIEPTTGPDGEPTAVVVVKPPPASSTLPAIPLPLAVPPVPPVASASAHPRRPGLPVPSPPAGAAPIEFK